MCFNLGIVEHLSPTNMWKPTIEMSRVQGNNAIPPCLCISTDLPVASTSNLLRVAGRLVSQLCALDELAGNGDVVHFLVEVPRAVVFHILQDPSRLVDDKWGLQVPGDR